jgi:hypothetical protein
VSLFPVVWVVGRMGPNCGGGLQEANAGGLRFLWCSWCSPFRNDLDLDLCITTWTTSTALELPCSRSSSPPPPYPPLSALRRPPRRPSKRYHQMNLSALPITSASSAMRTYIPFSICRKYLNSTTGGRGGGGVAARERGGALVRSIASYQYRSA